MFSRWLVNENAQAEIVSAIERHKGGYRSLLDLSLTLYQQFKIEGDAEYNKNLATFIDRERKYWQVGLVAV